MRNRSTNFVSDGVDQFRSFANSILPYQVENTTVVDIDLIS
ncbi:MAG: hypothetical protein ACLSD6_01065 [Clostridium sp.]